MARHDQPDGSIGRRSCAASSPSRIPSTCVRWPSSQSTSDVRSGLSSLSCSPIASRFLRVAGAFVQERTRSSTQRVAPRMVDPDARPAIVETHELDGGGTSVDLMGRLSNPPGHLETVPYQGFSNFELSQNDHFSRSRKVTRAIDSASSKEKGGLSNSNPRPRPVQRRLSVSHIDDLVADYGAGRLSENCPGSTACIVKR